MTTDTPTSATTPKATKRQHYQADAAERATKAWQARVAGATWTQAAAIAGFSDDTAACRAVKRFYGRLPQPTREDLRGLWRERLEALWRQTVKDVAQQRPGAVRSGVAVAQRAAALDGLDEPTRLEVHTPTQEEFMQIVAAATKELAPPIREADIFAETYVLEPAAHVERNSAE